MSNPADNLIASLLSQHVAEQDHKAKTAPVVTFSMTPKPSAKPSVKRAPIHDPKPLNGVTVGIAGVEKGSLDAAGFMLAIRNAGKRPNDKGIMVRHPDQERGDIIKAIHAYVGYDPRGNFGTQDQAARAKAQAELRPTSNVGPSREEMRSASRSLAGYVAGMPDHSMAANRERLLNQERVTAEAIIDLEKSIPSMPESTLDEKIAKLEAKQELGRLQCLLSNTQATLASYGVK